LLPDRCQVDLVTHAEVPARPGVTVHRAGPNSPELRRLYAEADVFALPTYADGLPMVIMEAMASGLPVIATPVGAIAEAVEHGQTGLIVQPGAVAELRAALVSLIEQPAWRQAMGRTARQRAEEQLDAHANARRIRDLLLAAVARR
jgi:glycosyltransferase involved in cell wall biosynthesis